MRVVMVLITVGLLGACTPQEADLKTGLLDGQLRPCEALPNCISSSYPAHEESFQEPWQLKIPPEKGWEELKKELNNISSVKILDEKEYYMHSTFGVPFWGYTDHVEFYIAEDGSEIHFRSASGIGSWDWGINRRRMKILKRELRRKSVVK